MGLCNLKHLEKIIEARKEISTYYDEHLTDVIQRPLKSQYLKYNFGYYPVIFQSETEMLRVKKALNSENIFPRRYFYPSLNTLPYLEKHQECPISERISSRILCLPLYVGLDKEIVFNICKLFLG
jgi:dTDP-4-amino-4,6-dideoxygalactose transaminase